MINEYLELGTKQISYKYRKDTPGQSINGKNMKREKFIPKNIIDEDVPAFMGALAQAAKAGKKEFKFGEKTYKVNLKKDVADKITKNMKESEDLEENIGVQDGRRVVVKALTKPAALRLKKKLRMKFSNYDFNIDKSGLSIIVPNEKHITRYIQKQPEVDTIGESKDFEPHMMYDPKTGKAYKAEKPEDHERMSKLGYTHEKKEETSYTIEQLYEQLAEASATDYMRLSDKELDELLTIFKNVGRKAANPVLAALTREKKRRGFKESNEFTRAAAKAKLAGDSKFEFEGETYPVEIEQDAAEKIMGKKESTELEEAVKWWTVTITRNVGMTKKGTSVETKARNSAEAIKKGLKQMKFANPKLVPSNAIDAKLSKNQMSTVESTELEEATLPFKELEKAWIRTKGNPKRREKLVKKHNLKPLISNVRPGSIKLGPLNDLKAKSGNFTIAGLDADGELIFITNNPIKIHYPSNIKDRPRGEELITDSVSLEALRLRKVVEVSLGESIEHIDTFISEASIDMTMTPSAIQKVYKKYMIERRNKYWN